MMSKKESGFTLIEIVMVLVLLGILMAVAAPKYFDLQKEARQQATYAIVAEVQSRLNAEFATQLLAGKDCSDARDIASQSVGGTGTATDVTDNKVTSPGSEWTVAIAASGTDALAVTVTWGDDDEMDAINVQLPVCKVTN